MLHNKLRHFTVLLVLLLAVSPASPAQRKNKDKNREARAGTSVLWREPVGIEQRNLLLGAGGETMKPDVSHVTFLEDEKGGYSTKYRVRDGAGNEWVAKIGKEAQSETASSHLLWAIGYFADVDYLVPSVRVDGIKKPLTNARFSARRQDQSYSSIPAVHARPQQSQGVLQFAFGR